MFNFFVDFNYFVIFFWNALIETTASAYEDPSEVIEYYKSNQELMSQMQNVALEEQAIDWALR